MNLQDELDKLRCINADLYKCDYCKHKNNCDRQEELEIKQNRK